MSIDTQPPSLKSHKGAFPTFRALGRLTCNSVQYVLRRVPYYRYALLAIGVFTLLVSAFLWRENERTRPTRELYEALGKRMVTVHNLSRTLRRYRLTPLLARHLPSVDEADDSVKVIFRNSEFNPETISLACRLGHIHDIDLQDRDFDPSLLRPFRSHPEIRGLNLRNCPLDDQKFAQVLECFPNLKWVYLEGMPLTDASVDLLISRKISVPTGSEGIRFTPQAIARLKAEKLTR